MGVQSFWFEEVQDLKRFPTLEDEISVDICVIGGGIAGISAAYFLSQEGYKTALLEMGNLGTGDTGFTTAFAAHFLDSVEKTVEAWEASSEGLRLMREIVGKEKIACDWKDIDEVGFTRKEDTSAFRKDFETFLKADSSLEYFEGGKAKELVGFPVSAAIRNKGESQFHIRKFLISLAEKASYQKALIFEESEALQITFGSPIVIQTAKGKITTERLVVASGEPPRQFFPEVSKHLSGAVTFVLHIALAPTISTDAARNTLSKPFTNAMFWDDEEPFHYFRWVNDKEAILGGEDYFFGNKKSGEKPAVVLENWLRFVSPNAQFQKKSAWQGTLFYTPDKLPFIGPHPAYGEKILFLTGFAGSGMVHGFLSGKMACDFVSGRKNPHQPLFSFEKRI